MYLELHKPDNEKKRENNDFKGTSQEETNLETNWTFANHIFFIINFHEIFRDSLTGYLLYSE